MKYKENDRGEVVHLGKERLMAFTDAVLTMFLMIIPARRVKR